MASTTSCATCGTVINENPDIEREPCPKCGSMARNINVQIEESVTVKASVGSLSVVGMDAILEKGEIPRESLLLQTVIVPGAKTSEGQLIEAVPIPWFEIIALIVKDPASVYQIGPRKWEEIIAGAYKKAGWDEVILTPRSGDFGRDVIATKRGIGSVRVIDQVKAYKPGHLVKADEVRALMGVLQGDTASKGFLSTTSYFAPKLPDDPFIRPFIPSQLELINRDALINRLREMAKK